MCVRPVKARHVYWIFDVNSAVNADWATTHWKKADIKWNFINLKNKNAWMGSSMCFIFYVTLQFDSRWFTRWPLLLLAAAISAFTLTPTVSKLIFTWLCFSPDHLSGTGRNHRHPFHRQHSSKAQIIFFFAPCARSCVRSRTATNLKRNWNEKFYFYTATK